MLGMEPDEELRALLKEFFEILEIEEESDSGRRFHPTIITSCRVMDLDRLNKILEKLKEFSKY